jgi:hypothetical protein
MTQGKHYDPCFDLILPFAIAMTLLCSLPSSFKFLPPSHLVFCFLVLYRDGGRDLRSSSPTQAALAA